MAISSEAKQEVVRLIISDRKIEAIKYLKDTLHLSLHEAHALVELVDADLQSGKISPAADDIPVTSPELWSVDRTEVRKLILAGKKMEAVNYIKETFGKNLKEARAIVDEEAYDLRFNKRAPKTGRTPLNFFHYIFGAISLVLFVIAALFFYHDTQVVKRSVKIKGTVIAILKYDSESYHAVATYEWNGKPYQYESSASGGEDYQVGEGIDLFVNPEKPEEAMMDNFSDRWLGFTVVTIIGLFFGIFFVLFVFLARRF